MDLTWSNISTHLGPRRLGQFFYLVDPTEHMPKTVDQIRNYFNESTMLLILFLLTETLIDYKSKRPSNIQDLVANAGHMLLFLLVKVPLKGSAALLYDWVYTNYRIVDLPHNSIAVWILGFFAADLNHYFVHRMNHEVHLFWTTHELHHAPENMALSAALRSHVLYFITFLVIFNPFAFIIPTAINLVHNELGFVYQIWLHTEKINKCPRLFEYIFNTPSHHRVHHGRNRKYIDKNYGAVLIVWDRIFGTYEDEDPDDKPVYGITKQLKSFNPMVTHTKPFYDLWEKARSYSGVKNKFFAIVKGPGWSPGKPWTGRLEDVPHPPEHFEKYYPQIPFWAQVYVVLHFFSCGSLYVMLAHISWAFPDTCSPILFCYVIYSIFTIGFLQDNSRFAAPLEILRLIFFFILDGYMVTDVPTLQTTVRVFMFSSRMLFVGSTLMWILAVMSNNLGTNLIFGKSKDMRFPLLWGLSRKQTEVKLRQD